MIPTIMIFSRNRGLILSNDAWNESKNLERSAPLKWQIYPEAHSLELTEDLTPHFQERPMMRTK